MAKYQRVLVATDFGTDGQLIIERAEETAQMHGADLWIIHVQDRVPFAYNDPTGAMLETLASLEAELAETAATEMAKLQDRLGVPTGRTHICTGRAATEIRRYAEANNIDLIVMGTHGQHGLGLLLGSTANGVLHGIGCDALIVRVGEEA